MKLKTTLNIEMVLIVLAVAVVAFTVGYPNMYNSIMGDGMQGPTTSMSTPMPQSSPMTVVLSPTNTQTPVIPSPTNTMQPVQDEPVDVPSPFRPPGDHEGDDPNLTPKENCEKRRDEAFDICIEEIETIPNMSRLDCMYNFNQDSLSCLCEQPILPNNQTMCSSSCHFDLATCHLIATHLFDKCNELHIFLDPNCAFEYNQNLERCGEIHRDCIAFLAPPPTLFATMGPTTTYSPPS